VSPGQDPSHPHLPIRPRTCLVAPFAMIVQAAAVRVLAGHCVDSLLSSPRRSFTFYPHPTSGETDPRQVSSALPRPTNHYSARSNSPPSSSRSPYGRLCHRAGSSLRVRRVWKKSERDGGEGGLLVALIGTEGVIDCRAWQVMYVERRPSAGGGSSSPCDTVLGDDQ
jgi:hypothetical protein